MTTEKTLFEKVLPFVLTPVVIAVLWIGAIGARDHITEQTIEADKERTRQQVLEGTGRPLLEGSNPVPVVDVEVVPVETRFGSR